MKRFQPTVKLIGVVMTLAPVVTAAVKKLRDKKK